MHPAPSIILFTVLSGLGFGLMAWLGLGAVDVEGYVAATFCAIAISLAGAGLLSSLFHLGHPERFMKALTQWRSSWLSREGVLAVATLCVFGLFSILWAGFSIRSIFLGALSAALALSTIFCTAMIYAQMKTVPRWHSPLTPAIFLLAAITGGALLTGSSAFGWLAAILGLLQLADWKRGGTAFQTSGTTLSTATGFSNLGTPRSLAPPHTGTNYLLREMVFVLGRDNAQKLRIAAFLLAIIFPLFLSILFQPGHVTSLIAFLSYLAGLLALRWLFFAQAEHVVGLYYGKR